MFHATVAEEEGECACGQAHRDRTRACRLQPFSDQLEGDTRNECSCAETENGTNEAVVPSPYDTKDRPYDQ
jgi:hypothetical protein